MSQFPPPGQPQYPQQYPQQPMNPQYAPPGMMMPAPTRTSAAAVVSLVMGIIGCIPFVTSLVAVICGIIGIRATGNPQVRGRGMAIAGLILGLIGLLLWTIFGTAGIGLYLASRGPEKTAKQFATDIAAGNVQAATSNADASLTPAEVQTLADQVKPWGALSNLMIPGRNVTTENGVTTWSFIGQATFTTGGAKTVEIELKKQSDGSYKVSRAKFQ